MTLPGPSSNKLVNIDTQNIENKISKKADIEKKSKNPTTVVTVRYHSGGSMKLNACILLLAHMVYL